MSVQIINRVFTLLVGDRKVIKQSINSGAIPAVFVTLLIVVYVAITNIASEFLNLISLDGFSAWYIFLCLALGFAILGGSSLGWLITRPLAIILGKALPHYEELIIWIISSALVWAATVVLTIWPLLNQLKVLQWILFVFAIAVAAIFGALGGRTATKTVAAPITDYRELARFGGVITGSMIVMMFLLLELFLPTTEASRQISPAIGFIPGVAFVSFFCIFAYLLIILPLSGLLLKARCFRVNPHLAYVLVSTTCWLIPGLVLFGSSADFKLLGGLVAAIMGGFCGACGGWAIGILKYDVILSNMSLVQE